MEIFADQTWWPYLFIALAGWIATDLWRWMGVLAGNRLREESEALNWVRALATALVMAVTAKLVVFPTGSLADTPMWIRIAAALLGFAAFFLTGQRVIVCVSVSIASLALGLSLFS